MIEFSSVKLPYGWMGNMSPFPIIYDSKRWLTTEALFQAMRFSNHEIKELIRSQKSPIAAKMKAKKNKAFYIVEPMSEKDIENMSLCVALKLNQYPDLKIQLLETGDDYIFENIGTRNKPNDLFWGAKMINGELLGSNMMGKIWMEFREKLRAG